MKLVTVECRCSQNNEYLDGSLPEYCTTITEAVFSWMAKNNESISSANSGRGLRFFGVHINDLHVINVIY